MPLVACDGTLEPVQKALASGLFSNVVQLAETTYEGPNSPGTDVYHLIRTTGAGKEVVSSHMKI